MHIQTLLILQLDPSHCASYQNSSQPMFTVPPTLLNESSTIAAALSVNTLLRFSTSFNTASARKVMLACGRFAQHGVASKEQATYANLSAGVASGHSCASSAAHARQERMHPPLLDQPSPEHSSRGTCTRCGIMAQRESQV